MTIESRQPVNKGKVFIGEDSSSVLCNIKNPEALSMFAQPLALEGFTFHCRFESMAVEIPGEMV